MARHVLMLALLPTVAAADSGTPPKHPTIRPGCAVTGPQTVADKGRAGLKRLDQLPPANEQLTVLRTEGGCQKPVIVRTDIGGYPARR